MNNSYRFCPWCGGGLSARDEKGKMSCLKKECGFVFYNNPIPVVVAVIPMYSLDYRYHPFNLPKIKEFPKGGLVCVKRKFAPHPGEWCLPCGFVDAHEDPKDAVEREALEETGLKAKAYGNPIVICNSGKSNRLMLVYLVYPCGGELKAGDDAEDVAVFGYDNTPNLCFPVHVDVAKGYWRGDFRP